MRRILPAILAFPAIAFAAAPAQAQEPVIRPGVTVAGVDVSNQPLSEAAGTIDRAFHHQLLIRNVSARVGGKGYRLTTKAAKVVFDPAKSARRAYIAGTKTAEPVDVLPWVSYDARRLAAFVASVDRASRIVPRNATVRITLRHMIRRHSHSGRETNDKQLAKLLAKALTDPRAPRQVRPQRTVVKAPVTAKDLARVYRTVVTVDKSHFRLRLFKRLRFVKAYGVAVGQPAYPTPSGLFHITDKAVNPTWNVPNSPWAGALRNESVPGGSSANPLKARWMGVVNGVGIHGTADDWSIGSRASHGCIRMHVWDVVDLYPRVPVGTPVLIR